MGARRRERKLFWVDGECKSGLRLEDSGDGGYLLTNSAVLSLA